MTAVTVGIKALNEEAHIAAALESALTAVTPFAGEVILADSGSTDATIAIARRYPVRILQLRDPAVRSCGAGAQLAFQGARGDYFYLLDGDMVLAPGFLAAGIAYLEAHPQAGAVGGRVRQCNTASEEFRIRADAVVRDAHWRAGAVDRLDCGGLYRSAAIRQIGYFADRNLHSFEEFDLGARLAAAGWTLARIDVPAVDHFGHTSGGYRLLWRRLRTGYVGGPGEVLRAALGRPHAGIVLRGLGHIRTGIAVIVWWGLLIAAAALMPWLLVALVAAPLAFLSWRRGSLALGVYSLASWNATACGLLSGLMRRRVPPTEPLAAVDIAGDTVPGRARPVEA